MSRIVGVSAAFVWTLVGGCRAAQPAGSRLATSAASRDTVCTAALLARTPPYDTLRVGELAGRYRWRAIDTLSTRVPLPAEALERATQAKPFPRAFWLRPTDSRLRVATPRAPNKRYRRAIGPLSGIVLDGDTTGFSPEHPQVEVSGGRVHYLTILYDPRVGEGLLDGGHVMELLPIQVLGSWGFGGYYDTAGDLIGFLDRNGKWVPTFAGYYCAFRLDE